MRLIDDNEHRRLLLRLLMRRHNVTATQVAALAGVRPQTVRLWMCGLRSTPKEILRALRAYRRTAAAA